jgi:hypothetical protein
VGARVNRHPVVPWWQRLVVLATFFLGVYLVTGAVDLVRSDAVAPKPRERAPAELAGETARLQREVLPVLAELQVTWFEKGPCALLADRRGMFTTDGTCAGGREGERTFDTTARADLDRILAALARTGVATKDRATAIYDADGTLSTAGFSLTDTTSYLYSPSHPPSEWDSPLGRVKQRPISTPGWYLQTVEPTSR